jgi:hypothetical protein
MWRWLGTWRPAFAGDSEKDASTAYSVSPPLPLGDLDGDGIPDRLVMRRAGVDPALTDSPLRAYSGKDGRRLWRADGVRGALRQNNRVTECFRLECRDLHGNGRPVVLFVYGVGEFSGGSAPNECWLAVLSGPDGKLLWKEKIGGFETEPGHGSPTKCPKSLALHPPGFADLNGDGVLDLVVLAQTEPTGGTEWGQELRALDGRDGRLLWRQPLRGHHSQIQ